jgi:hypothetical protein
MEVITSYYKLDTNEVARSHKSKDKQHNGQMKKDKQHNGQMKKDKQRSTKHYSYYKLFLFQFSGLV